MNKNEKRYQHILARVELSHLLINFGAMLATLTGHIDDEASRERLIREADLCSEISDLLQRGDIDIED